jgi:hypothetical protein
VATAESTAAMGDWRQNRSNTTTPTDHIHIKNQSQIQMVPHPANATPSLLSDLC